MPRTRVFTLTLCTLAALAAGVLVSAPARAVIPHDLELDFLKVGPAPLERGCKPVTLEASFWALGVDDPKVKAVEIVFEWSPGSGTGAWNGIATSRVTFDPQSQPLFPGVLHTVIQSWTPPESLPQSITVRATIRYADSSIVEPRKNNNSVSSQEIPTKAGNCSTGSGPTLRPLYCSPLFSSKDWVCTMEIVAVERWMLKDLERLPATLRKIRDCQLTNPEPDKCARSVDPVSPLCKSASCPPCVQGLSCPSGERFAVRFATPVEDLDITLRAGETGEFEIARAELVGRGPYEPGKRFGGETEEGLSPGLEPGQEVFFYHLEFDFEPGVDYRLSVTPGKATPLDEPISVEATVGRPGELPPH